MRNRKNYPFAEGLKRDVNESIHLYFAPLNAVVREFRRAVRRVSHEPITVSREGSRPQQVQMSKRTY